MKTQRLPRFLYAIFVVLVVNGLKLAIIGGRVPQREAHSYPEPSEWFGTVLLDQEKNYTMNSAKAIGSGLAGAVALNVLHESLRRVVPFAPRMDKLGQQALALIIQKIGKKQPSKGELYALTLVGDLVGNALFYGLVGSNKSKSPWLKGSLLGAAAGAGAVLLPEKLGLNPKPSSETTKTTLMTLGLYLAGGLVAAGALHLLEKKFSK